MVLATGISSGEAVVGLGSGVPSTGAGVVRAVDKKLLLKASGVGFFSIGSPKLVLDGTPKERSTWSPSTMEPGAVSALTGTTIATRFGSFNARAMRRSEAGLPSVASALFRMNSYWLIGSTT